MLFSSIKLLILKYIHVYFFLKLLKKNHGASYGPRNTVLSLVPLVFTIKILYEFIFPSLSICPSNLILPRFITKIIFGENKQLQSYSTWIFLNAPVATSFYAPILSWATCSETPSNCGLSYIWHTQFRVFTVHYYSQSLLLAD